MKKTIITSDGRFAVTFKSKGPAFYNEPIVNVGDEFIVRIDAHPMTPGKKRDFVIKVEAIDGEVFRGKTLSGWTRYFRAENIIETLRPLSK